jgi:hypothetical protein
MDVLKPLFQPMRQSYRALQNVMHPNLAHTITWTRHPKIHGSSTGWHTPSFHVTSSATVYGPIGFSIGIDNTIIGLQDLFFDSRWTIKPSNKLPAVFFSIPRLAFAALPYLQNREYCPNICSMRILIRVSYFVNDEKSINYSPLDMS